MPCFGSRWAREKEQRLELNAKQLSEGSVVYWPRHSDVDFRFELLSPGGNVSQSVRSIGGPTKPAVANPAPKRWRSEAPIRPEPSRKSLSGNRICAACLRTQGQRRRRGTGSSRPRFSPRVLLRCRGPHLIRSRAAALSVPDPPAIRPAPLEHSKEVLKTIGPDNSPIRAEPSFHVTVEPVTGSRRSIPLIGKRNRRPDYVPPAAAAQSGALHPSQSQPCAGRQNQTSKSTSTLPAKWTTPRSSPRCLRPIAIWPFWRCSPRADGSSRRPATGTAQCRVK